MNTTDLSLDQARQHLLQLCGPSRLGSELLPLRQALGHVLAADISAPFDLPAADNAAMDGYALRAADFAAGQALSLVGRALAGHAYTGSVPPGGCVRITTGAPLPADCDCVVQQELCRVDNDRVLIDGAVPAAGLNVRRRGDDQRAGSSVLGSGRVLRPADIGLLATLGLERVETRLPLRVALFSSGDELRSPGETLGQGDVYDSNRDLLWALLQTLGCEPIDLGRCQDDPARLRALLREASARADVVLSTGGVGVGDADHLKTVMAELGDIANWRVALRPGRPLAFGRIADGSHSTLLIGLPGNPVAVAVTFYALVRDALLQLMGAAPRPLPRQRVTALHDLAKRPGRTELPRARLQQLADGSWGADCSLHQGAGGLGSLSQADGLLLLEHDRGPIRAGEPVDFVPFDGLL